MAGQWYIAHNRMGRGPFSIEQLRQMTQSQSLQPTDMLLETGRLGWIKASSMPGLFDVSVAAVLLETQLPLATPSPSDTTLNQGIALKTEVLTQTDFATVFQEHRLLESYRMQNVMTIPQLFPAPKPLAKEKQTPMPAEAHISDCHTLLGPGVRGVVFKHQQPKGYGHMGDFLSEIAKSQDFNPLPLVVD